ncbi:L,D-transpeptidase [Streptomyces qinzhouensis]|uniref:L,D-transpeptidase family protein n=1 Tax=Streptomyces qinzhouensis TaxID=2599401 RepID=A0A5B8JCP8_9ACTN|nr:Ig-like domain-containing protein [Streptomyces qinzhouensis]QDY79116.1 L,D-transpeptidase family protein [Streptomyces qinzhouensis]
MRHVLKRTGRGALIAVARVGLAGLLAGLSGCAPGGGEGGDSGVVPPQLVSGEVIRVTPEDGARGVDPKSRLEVRLTSGRLERVTVNRIENEAPTAVPGAISADGLRWRPAEGTRLGLAAKYSVDVVALDGHGRRTARHTTFTTKVPESRFIGYFKPEHRSTVGTGMIVSFDFNRKITDRAAVRQAIRVSSDPPVEIAGHWFGDQRLDFRPERYWTPGTKVTVDIGLRDVEAAPGAYGIQDKTVVFTVGRSQISLVDAEAKTMEVRNEGSLIATLPITAGAPNAMTYNGKMVVSEMHDVTRMNGATVGFTDNDGKGEYDIKDVPHAMRLTRTGTFLHGNYWASADIFGTANVSHGCVGLRDVKGGSGDTPAGWFFDRTLIGDVVEVINSHDKTVAPDNGLSGWNMSWEEWKR